MNIMAILKRMFEKKPKRIPIPSEEEYYAERAKPSSMELHGSERDRRAARMIRQMPYESYKMIIETMNRNAGYR